MGGGGDGGIGSGRTRREGVRGVGGGVDGWVGGEVGGVGSRRGRGVGLRHSGDDVWFGAERKSTGPPTAMRYCTVDGLTRVVESGDDERQE